MIIKTLVVSIIILAILFFGGVLDFGSKQKQTVRVGPIVNNVAVIDGKQIITIKAKGNYSPKVTNAKADMPTIVKMDTQGTFDCTAALTIPNLDVKKNLPASGETEIEIPPQKAGATINGLCGMGMYSFAINFN